MVSGLRVSVLGVRVQVCLHTFSTVTIIASLQLLYFDQPAYIAFAPVQRLAQYQIALQVTAAGQQPRILFDNSKTDTNSLVGAVSMTFRLTFLD